LAAAAPDAAGLASGNLRLGGALDSPRISAELRLDSLRLGPVFMDRADASATYAAGVLDLDRISILRSNSSLGGAIGVPLEISLLAPPAWREEGELSGELDFSGRAEDLLGLSDLVAEAGGDLSASVLLAGSPAAPRPTGRLRLRAGLLRLSGWEETLEGMDADAEILGDTLHILSAHAREGRKWSRKREGEVSGRGWVTWRAPLRYAGEARLKNAYVGTLPFFSGLVSGDVSLARWEEEGVPPHPFIGGDLLIHEGVLS
jgi:autotransporter translocation and assembly factor TamB